MTDGQVVTVLEAIKMIGEPLEKVQALIASGQLKVTFDQARNDNVVLKSSIDEYIAKKQKPINPNEKFKIAIIDNDYGKVNILKLELSRDKRFEVKSSGFGADGIVLVRSFKPNIILYHYDPGDNKTADFIERLIGLVVQMQPKVVVYTWSVKSSLRTSKVRKLGASEAHDVTQTTRQIITRVYEKLGIPR